MLDISDGGFASRKLWFGIGTSIAICTMAILGAWVLPALIPQMPTVIGGLLAVLGLFIGGNLGQSAITGKFLVNRHELANGEVESTEEADVEKK